MTDDEFYEIRVIDDENYPFDSTAAYYLAGPMSGYPEYNFPEFGEAAGMLRASGINVLSPHEIDHGETPETRGSLPYQTYIKAGIDLLEKCQGIILLRGWPQSSGSCNELSRAIDLGFSVWFFQHLGNNPQLINMNRRPPA